MTEEYKGQGIELDAIDPEAVASTARQKVSQNTQAPNDTETPQTKQEIEEPKEQEVEEIQEEESETVDEDTEPSHEAPKKEHKEENINMVALRKAREAAEKERDEYRRKVEEMEKYYKQADPSRDKKADPIPEPIDEDFTIDPDDFVEGKHIAKFNDKIKRLEQKLAEQEQRSALSATEKKIKTKYPDFDSVVSEENVKALALVHPEIANSLASSPDLYNKACAAYTLIKKFGIDMSKTYQKEDQKIQSNLSKPRASAGKGSKASSSPLAQADAFSQGPLTEEQKRALYEDMCRCAG